MLVGEFIQWWYGAGYAWLFRSLGGRMHRLALTFSVPILLRTLVSPWRRIISYGGNGLEAQLRAALDNAVSRMVGLSVRLIVLVAAGVSLAALGLAGAILLVLWPLAPLGGLYLLVRGFLAW